MFRVMLFVTAYIFVGFIAYGLAYFGFGQDRFDFLSNYGIQTSATVTAKNDEQHHAIIYSYTVDGIQYTGIGRGLYGNPRSDEIQPGSTLIAFYDPEGPWDSFLGYPQIMRDSNSRAILQIALFAPAIPVGFAAIAYALFCLFRRKRGFQSPYT